MAVVCGSLYNRFHHYSFNVLPYCLYRHALAKVQQQIYAAPERAVSGFCLLILPIFTDRCDESNAKAHLHGRVRFSCGRDIIQVSVMWDTVIHIVLNRYYTTQQPRIIITMCTMAVCVSPTEHSTGSMLSTGCVCMLFHSSQLLCTQRIDIANSSNAFSFNAQPTAPPAYGEQMKY